MKSSQKRACCDISLIHQGDFQDFYRNGNLLAFYKLYRYHNKNFYAEPGFSTFQGYLVLAADGSGINIPTNRETLEEFGTSSRKGTKPRASIGLGCLYDVMNRMILESDCCKCKFDEMRLAEEQIDHVRETIGILQPFLVVMDRGYPSTAAFIRMMDKGAACGKIFKHA